MTERSKRIGEMIRRGMETPRGVQGIFLLRCRLCGLPSLLHREPVPAFAVWPLPGLSPGGGHQLPLPGPACCGPPSPGPSLFSFWFSVHPRALLQGRVGHDWIKLKFPPPKFALRHPKSSWVFPNPKELTRPRLVCLPCALLGFCSLDAACTRPPQALCTCSSSAQSISCQVASLTPPLTYLGTAQTVNEIHSAPQYLHFTSHCWGLPWWRRRICLPMQESQIPGLGRSPGERNGNPL